MCVGVTNAAGGDANENIGGTETRNWNFAFFQWFAEFYQLHRFHGCCWSSVQDLRFRIQANSENRTSNTEQRTKSGSGAHERGETAEFFGIEIGHGPVLD